ncbi:MAG: hypothetical protein IT317_03890 [Anaerolineales bacterium]|nr:hypothetical protein [Anaerolineales bacterium]
MDQLVLDVNPEAAIYVTAHGELRLSGWDHDQFVAEAADEHTLRLDQGQTPLALTAESDVAVRVPRGARVVVTSVGGDAQVKGLEGPLHLQNVGGDLRLRQTADTEIGNVGGDMSAKKVGGFLRVGQVGGDLLAHRVQGDLAVEHVGGDLFLRDVEGGVQAAAGGDVSLNVDFRPGQVYQVQTNSDLTCRADPAADALFDATAGGDLNVNLPGAQIEGNGRHKRVRLGGGDPAVTLKAGGDLNLSGAASSGESLDDFGDRFGEDFGVMADEFAAQIETTIETQIESQLADFERQLNEKLAGLNTGTVHLKAEELAAKARRVAERQAEQAKRRLERQGETARRHAEAAQRRAEQQAERARRQAEAAQRRAEVFTRRSRSGSTWSVGFAAGPRPPAPPAPPNPPAPPAAPVSDEERMTILRMVEQGKISVEDAEKLLAALEGN